VPSTDHGSVDTGRAGRAAESQAARHLEALGYVVLEQNYRCEVGELDLVAREAGDLVFVEVRSRADGDHGDASFAVGWPKQRQVARVAAFYLLERAPPCTTCRFDVVAITGDHIEVFTDAFRIGV
jgi:putative endonuclease